MANVLLAMRCFSKLWASKAVTFHVDNKAVVYSLSKGKMKNATLQALSRTKWLIAATNDITLAFKHIPGALNQKADVLSRVFEPDSGLHTVEEYINCVWWPVDGSWCTPNMYL